VLIWLALVVGYGLLCGWAGPWVHRGGPVLLGIVGLLAFTGTWWFTIWFLLGGRVSWRRLFPPAVATGVFFVGMLAVFSLFLSGMVISDTKKYGPIGTVFALMSWLLACGVVIILGAATGLVWQERGLSFKAALRKVRRTR
jgi:membrane protein